MKHRHVFSVPDAGTARKAVAVALSHGIDDGRITLVARRDIELESLPPERIDASTDTIPAAFRGALEGGGLGLLAGLIALAIPALGVTIAGAGLIAAIGATVGTWSSALMGSALPSEVRCRFEDEIEEGRILVVLDGDRESLADVEAALLRSGATLLPFDRLSLIS
ncbi:hypothetical protein [Dokdonella sp.]|uniref:hypothetical protein n=1 Tax=Dokdonella sp. TaxID=2291710 RepID=UPI002602A94D|nr:hypothetical protein [Dokdonella sp.]